MEQMFAAQFLGPQHLQVQTVPMPELSDGEALLSIDACGFCGSDLNIVAGTHPRAKPPLIIGHELSGRIVRLRGEASGYVEGDRVTVFPLISCGHCHACTHGNSHVCRELRLFGFDVDGGMAQYMRVPTSALLRLPEAMSPEIGALIEPLAVAVHGVGQCPLEEISLAVVLGAGPIGLLAGLVAKHHGIPRVIVSDVIPARLDLARSLGLEAVAAGETLRGIIMKCSNQNGADAVIECAGHPSSAREMTDIVRSRGTIVNLGVFKKPVEIDLQAINFKEVTLKGSRVYERKDFASAIKLAPSLPLQPIVSATYKLQDVNAVFDQFSSGRACKVLVLPSVEAV